MEDQQTLEQAILAYVRNKGQQKTYQDVAKKLTDKYREQQEDARKAQNSLQKVNEMLADQNQLAYDQLEVDVLEVAKSKEYNKLMSKGISSQQTINSLYGTLTQGSDGSQQRQEVLDEIRENANREVEMINFDEDEQILSFKRHCWRSIYPDKAFPLDQQDDDIQVDHFTQREFARNDRCPITGVNIMNLEEPMEDSHGFVYDKNAIIAYLNKQGGQAQCPIQGVSHLVKVSDLQVAHGIMHERKRRKVVPTQNNKGGYDIEAGLDLQKQNKMETQDQQQSQVPVS